MVHIVIFCLSKGDRMVLFQRAPGGGNATGIKTIILTQIKYLDLFVESVFQLFHIVTESGIYPKIPVTEKCSENIENEQFCNPPYIVKVIEGQER